MMIEFDNYVLGFVPYSIKEVQVNFQRWAYLVHGDHIIFFIGNHVIFKTIKKLYRK